MSVALGNDLSAGLNYLFRGSKNFSDATKMGACGWIRVSNGTQTLYAQTDNAGSINAWTVYLSSWVPTFRTYNAAGTASTVSGTAIARRQKQWIHLGIFSDGATVYYIVNGILSSTSSPPTAPGVPATSISSIGAHNIGAVPAGDAEMYDVCIFTGAAVDAVIANIPGTMKLAMAGKHCGEQGRYGRGRTSFNQAARIGQDNFSTVNSSVSVRRGPTLPAAYRQVIAGRIAKALSGTLFLQSLSGAMTPSGALLKTAVRSLAGGATPSGALVKLALRSLAGAVAPAGTLSRQIARALSGAAAPAGSLVKRTLRAVTGTVASAGALTATNLIARSLSGGMTPSGTLIRSGRKQLAGAIAPGGTMARRTSRSVVGVVDSSGSIAKTVMKSFTGVIASIGALITTLFGVNPPPTSYTGRVRLHPRFEGRVATYVLHEGTVRIYSRYTGRVTIYPKAEE